VSGRIFGYTFGRVPTWLLDAEVSDRAIRLFALLTRYADSPAAALRSPRPHGCGPKGNESQRNDSQIRIGETRPNQTLPSHLPFALTNNFTPAPLRLANHPSAVDG
jgi:hypothetical protein